MNATYNRDSKEYETGQRAAEAQADYAPQAASACCEGLPLEVFPLAANFHGSRQGILDNSVSANPKDIAGRSKCQVQLVPPVFIRKTADALATGAAKYGEANWLREPVQLRNYVAAIMRHSLAILDGEDIDAESGFEHVAHIAATCAIVMDARKHGTLIDDRPGK